MRPLPHLLEYMYLRIYVDWVISGGGHQNTIRVIAIMQHFNHDRDKDNNRALLPHQLPQRETLISLLTLCPAVHAAVDKLQLNTLQ